MSRQNMVKEAKYLIAFLCNLLIITGIYLYVATNKHHTFERTMSIVGRKRVTNKILNFSGPYYRELTKFNAFHLGWQDP